jgi:peptide/nickel transport system ATP-binding protein
LEHGRTESVHLTRLNANGRKMRQIRGGEIGLVFQEPMISFSPVHTVANQVAKIIRTHKNVSAAFPRSLVVDLFRRVGIPRPGRCADEYPFRLSGGLRQRAMIAMALSRDPRVSIADGPTTGLDVTTQVEILALLRRLRRDSGVSITPATHNLGVVAEMFSSVAVMYLGKIVEQAPVQAIFREPRHPYTKAQLRSIPGLESQSRPRLPTIEGSVRHPCNRPRGCLFYPRCQCFVPGKCDQQEPQTACVEPGHTARCLLFAAAQTGDS